MRSNLWVPDVVCTGIPFVVIVDRQECVLSWSPFHEFDAILDVGFVHEHRDRHPPRDLKRNANLVHRDVGVDRDDGAARKLAALAHQVVPA